jgi:hypothetical protein
MAYRRSKSLLIGALLALTTVAPRALADDQPFLTLYTTDIDSQGEREFEQWLFWNTREVRTSYQDFLSQSELEYGITDDLQGSLYLNYEWSRTRALLPPGPPDTDGALGVSGELIWRLLNVDFDPFGFALYAEPSYAPQEHGIETKLLFQKNFLNDTLRFAFNTNFEDDWDRDRDGWSKYSALEFDLGGSYNVTPDWSVGLEFDNERAFDGLVLGGSGREYASAFFLGPTIQFVDAPLAVTLGGQVQLPWANAPTGNPGAVVDGLQSDAPRYRVAIRISRDF